MDNSGVKFTRCHCCHKLKLPEETPPTQSYVPYIPTTDWQAAYPFLYNQAAYHNDYTGASTIQPSTVNQSPMTSHILATSPGGPTGDHYPTNITTNGNLPKANHPINTVFDPTLPVVGSHQRAARTQRKREEKALRVALTPEMIEFLRQSKARKQKKEEAIRQAREDEEREREDEAKGQELLDVYRKMQDTKYGKDGALRVAELQAALDLDFDIYSDTRQPPLWPSLPLRLFG